MVSAAARSVSIPIFCKIRLLDTYEETKTLCEQLYDAGASLIAVHGRYRATYHRKGPGARDGPALLDQIERLKADFTADERYSNRLLVTNGNTITYDDVVKNLELTKADGLMSAEGILDNPALFIGRLGDRSSDADGGKLVEVKGGKIFDDDGTSIHAKRQQLMKKLHKIEHIERKEPQNLTLKEQKKLSKKSKLIKKIAKLSGSTPSSENVDDTLSPISSSTSTSTFVPLRDLFDAADNKVTIALEYIRLVRRYPTTIRTVIFHTRRILKDELKTYQLMEDCLQCSSIDEVEILAKKIQDYQQNPNSFQFDQQKAKAEKEAIERKRIEEGKRKEFEARMIRKAKREGKTGSDLEYYLRVGTTVPTIETVSVLRSLSKEEQLKLWKDHDHSQHCMTFHLEGDCSRGRRCAFLHVPSQTQTTFVESDEVAG
jgi:tRNA-dihydrouridine synthase 1